jgi:hypothetical protein
VSRHHILPPIVYTPAPPKPKKTERRPNVRRIQKNGVAASEDVGETEETGEVSVATPTRSAAHPLQARSTPIESAERRIPSTTGKLSENTLKELLLAQEQEQKSAPGVSGAAPAAKP